MLTFVSCRACLGVPHLLSFFFPVPFPRLWSEGGPFASAVVLRF